MLRRIIPLICLILVSSMALGQEEDYFEGQFSTEAVFDLDSNGNARMTITEPLFEEFDEISLTVNADGSDRLTVAGTLIDEAMIYDPDFTLSVDGDADSARMAFEIMGGDISDILAESGDFELNLKMQELGDVLNLDVSGYVSREFVENELLVDPDELAEEANELKAEFESMLNVAFGMVSTPPPSFRISELSFQSGTRVSFTMKMSVENWKEMYSQLMSQSYEDPDELKFLYCIGASPELVAQSVLASDLGEVDVSITGSGNAILLDVVVSGSSIAGGEVSVTDMDLSIIKSGSRMDINGGVGITNLQTVVSCLMEDYIEGEYEVDDLRLMITKSADTTGTTTLEGNIRNFAKKSGDRWSVAIPEETTEEIAVTVNIPSSMEVFSVSGATQEGRSAKSEAGEEMVVVYGEGGAILGDNMWIIIIVVILLLAFFFFRGKKK